MRLTISEEEDEIARFVERCDKWCDAMNVHNQFYEGNNSET